jgi:hypothetical protein
MGFNRLEQAIKVSTSILKMFREIENLKELIDQKETPTDSDCCWEGETCDSIQIITDSLEIETDSLNLK